MDEYSVVINRCYGGFGISYEAYVWLLAHGIEPKYMHTDLNNKEIDSKKNVKIIYDANGVWRDVRSTTDPQEHTVDELNKLCYIHTEIPRHHPLLIQCVNELGTERASGPCAKLEIEKTSYRHYYIHEYDGYETLELECTDSWSDDGPYYIDVIE